MAQGLLGREKRKGLGTPSLHRSLSTEKREKEMAAHMGAGRRCKATDRTGRTLRDKQDRSEAPGDTTAPSPGTTGAPRVGVRLPGTLGTSSLPASKDAHDTISAAKEGPAPW